jgi:hypothetical protein
LRNGSGGHALERVAREIGVPIKIHITLTPETAIHRDALLAALAERAINVPDAEGHQWISVEGEIDDADLPDVLRLIRPPPSRAD